MAWTSVVHRQEAASQQGYECKINHEVVWPRAHLSAPVGTLHNKSLEYQCTTWRFNSPLIWTGSQHGDKGALCLYGPVKLLRQTDTRSSSPGGLFSTHVYMFHIFIVYYNSQKKSVRMTFQLQHRPHNVKLCVSMETRLASHQSRDWVLHSPGLGRTWFLLWYWWHVDRNISELKYFCMFVYFSVAVKHIKSIYILMCLSAVWSKEKQSIKFKMFI